MKKLGFTLMAAALSLPLVAGTPQASSTNPAPATTTKKHAKKHTHKHKKTTASATNATKK